jgi:hypothetical protein
MLSIVTAATDTVGLLSQNENQDVPPFDQHILYKPAVGKNPDAYCVLSVLMVKSYLTEMSLSLPQLLVDSMKPNLLVASEPLTVTPAIVIGGLAAEYNPVGAVNSMLGVSDTPFATLGA